MNSIDLEKLTTSNEMFKSKSIQTDPVSFTYPENLLNTAELLTNFYMEVYERELSLNKVNESIVLETVSNCQDTCNGVNIKTAISRCSYMYCYATSYTLLVKDCITRFLKEYSNLDLIKSWKDDLSISSVSDGPGLDCIAFSLAILEVSKWDAVFSNVSIIYQRKKWRNTVNILSEVLQEVMTPVFLNFVGPEVTFKNLFKPSKIKAISFIQSSNILLMFKPLKEKGFINRLCKIVESLKSGAFIFFIDYPTQSSVMQDILKKNQGNMLYGPVTMDSNMVKVEVSGNKIRSIPSFQMEFFVWVKCSSPPDSANYFQNLNENALYPSKVPEYAHATSMKSTIFITRNGLKKIDEICSIHADKKHDSILLLKSKGTQTHLVAEVLLENKLNSNQLVTKFFMEVYKSEILKFNFHESFVQSYVFELSKSCGKFMNNKARCAYIYYYATCHTLLIKKCFSIFLTEYPNTEPLLTKWKSNSNHCSLSDGPGIDYIAFNLAILEVSKMPLPITKVRIITHANWKNTFNILSEVFHKVKTSLNLNFELNNFCRQDSFGQWSKKALKYLKNSSVIFMFKTLNLKENEEYSQALMNMVQLLSNDALIFFMDSPASLLVMRKVLGEFPGTFLYGPTTVVSNKMQIKVPEEIEKTFGLSPTQSDEVEFFVWGKNIVNVTPKLPLKSTNFPATTIHIDPQHSQESSTSLPNPSMKISLKHTQEHLGNSSAAPIAVDPIHFQGSSLNFHSASKKENPIHTQNKLANIPIPSKKKSQSSTNLPASSVDSNSVSMKELQYSSLSDKPALTKENFETTSENQLETLTQIFMQVYQKEIYECEFKQSFALATVFELSDTFKANFNLIGIRCAYMYRYATCHTLLIKKCFTRFLTEYSNSGDLLSRWRLNSNVCSVSLGPGLDFMALNLALLELSQKPIEVSKINIITKFIGWKNTIDILSNTMQEIKTLPNLNFESSSVLVGNVFKPWSSATVSCLQLTSLLLMFKTIDLNEKEKNMDPSFLGKLIDCLYPGTVVFFMDTSHSSLIARKIFLNYPGIFLYGPVSVSCNNIPIGNPGALKKILGVLPVQSADVVFFVWEKQSNIRISSENLQHPKYNSNSSKLSSSSSESSDSISKALFTHKIQAPFNNNARKEISSHSTTLSTSSLSEKASGSPIFNWRLQQKKHINVESRDKIINYLKLSQNSDHSSPKSDSISFFDVKEKGSIDTVGHPFSQPLMKNEEITCKHETESATNYFEFQSSKPIVTNDCKSTFNPINSVDQELAQVSQTHMKIDSNKEILADNQINQIRLLIKRINNVASSISSDFGIPVRINDQDTEGEIVSEINILTEKINNLVNSIELTCDSQKHTSKNRGIMCCGCVCKTSCFSCHKDCDNIAKRLEPKPLSHSSNESLKNDVEVELDNFTPSHCIKHTVKCCEHEPSITQPSIVIPLENISPDLLSLILKCKK